MCLGFLINQEHNAGAAAAIENITTEYKTKNTKIMYNLN